MTQLLKRIRDSGIVPPLLLHDSVPEPEDGFDSSVMNLLDSCNNGLSLSPSFTFGEFDSIMKRAELKSLSFVEPTVGKKVIERRRSIILALVSQTFPDSPALKKLMSYGFLVHMNSWLIDNMKLVIGGIDLLLLILSSMRHLPVSKELISTSKIGKTIAQIEKSFSESPNLPSIMANVTTLKDEWTSYVKKTKVTYEKSDTTQESSPPSLKRERESVNSSPEEPSAPKKSKSKILSTSELLRKSGVSAEETKRVAAEESNLSAAELARRKAKERQEKERERISKRNLVKQETDSVDLTSEGIDLYPVALVSKAKRVETRVTFAEKPTILNEEFDEENRKLTGRGDWSTLKKNEHLLEKELLLNARKQHLQERHMKLDSMKPMTLWRTPEPLPISTPPVHVESDETSVQLTRIGYVRPMLFLSDDDVPVDPTPLSVTQFNLDKISQNNANPITIPFFAARQEAVSEQVSINQIPGSASVLGNNIYDESAKAVQAMGLPPFLIGYNIQALQTLASTPGLLQTFINAQGQYDEQRLRTLVETLSQTLNPNAQPVVAPTPQPSSVSSHYPPPSTLFQSSQQPQLYPLPPQPSLPSSFTHPSTARNTEVPKPIAQQIVKGVYRGDQNTLEGSNLHVSGYGPSTTKEEIIALFSPYVHVTELVPKGSFCFVNTNDPVGAKHAREALNGTIVGGLPIRINVATRKERDPNKVKGQKPLAVPAAASYGQVDYDNVRDDRGNYSTKNLFVAGYGTGTTENDIRSMFGQFGNVTGTVMKGTFCFVNTIDKETAVKARNGLTGVMLNGGPLRINFAKESGRLGTSFDQTYNSSTYGSGAHSQRVFM